MPTISIPGDFARKGTAKQSSGSTRRLCPQAAICVHPDAARHVHRRPAGDERQRRHVDLPGPPNPHRRREGEEERQGQN
jgi:hypothetical protein